MTSHPQAVPEGTSEAQSNSTIIQCKGLRKSFQGAPVLDGIDWSVRRGERVALLGPSGCGKTTLLRCLNALETVEVGELMVNGQNLRQPGLDVNAFRARVAMVFQQYNLFPHLSVLRNIMLGPLKVRKLPEALARERALQLLKQVGIAEKAQVYPDQLSGGQKQRVAIARALAMDPDILLLDEPTSALDPVMCREVLSVIAEVQGVTLVMVTHELRFVSRMADRLIILERGRIAEDGPPEAILNNPQSLAAQRYLEFFD